MAKETSTWGHDPRVWKKQCLASSGAYLRPKKSGKANDKPPIKDGIYLYIYLYIIIES